jgi:predicted Zn finger-like uncharacterized protein
VAMVNDSNLKSIECPSCGSIFRLKENSSGLRYVRCPHCKEELDLADRDNSKLALLFGIFLLFLGLGFYLYLNSKMGTYVGEHNLYSIFYPNLDEKIINAFYIGAIASMMIGGAITLYNTIIYSRKK